MTDGINPFDRTMNTYVINLLPRPSLQTLHNRPTSALLAETHLKLIFWSHLERSVGWIWWFLGCQMSFLSWSVSTWGSARSHEVTIRSPKPKVAIWHEHFYWLEIVRWWVIYSNFMLFKMIANVNKATDGLKSISLEVTYSWGHFPGISPFHWGSPFILWSLIMDLFTGLFSSNN